MTVVIVAASCGGGGSSAAAATTTTAAVATTTAAVATTTAAVATTTAAVATTTAAVATTTAAPTTTAAVTTTTGRTSTSLPPAPDRPWDQGDLPHVAGFDPSQLAMVVLVADGDVLNARVAPGVDAAVYAGLLPYLVVNPTGAQQVVSGTTWIAINTWVGPLWVNGTFLAPLVSPQDFEADPRVVDLLDRFARIIVQRGDLTPVISRRGLYVAHHAPPRRFRAASLPTLLTDPTTYYWATSGASADEVRNSGRPAMTFTEAVADSFVSAFDSTDRVTTFDEPPTGSNGPAPDATIIPTELWSFNYVGVRDPGGDPQYGGLDWTTWYVSINYENGSPVIVGLTLDEWAP